MSLSQMSFAGAVMILAITMIRALTINKLPKKTFLALWGITLIRLLVPFSLSSVFSVYSLFGKNTQQTTTTNHTAIIPFTNLPTTQSPITAGIANKTASNISVWTAIWATGALACALFFALTYRHCLREFQTSLPVENRFVKNWLTEHPLKRTLSIRQSDRISAPLTFGIFHPVILMPKRTNWQDETSLQYILTHEYVHIQRFDTVSKLILIDAVCVHWFNPLVWVMYVLANRDLELSCDESVIRRFGESSKTSYAQTLIRMEETKSSLTPLCNNFSKNAIEERIVAIMKTKKTTWAAFLAATILVVGVGTAFATSAQTVSNINSEKPESSISDKAILSTVDEKGNVQYSTDGGQTYLDEEEFHKKYSIPNVEWWTYEEYKAWLEDEKVQLQSMIGETAWTGGLGEFVWTQEIVDETIAQYEKTLEEIKNGLKVSKYVDGSDDVMLSGYEGGDSAMESVVGTAIVMDNGATVTFGPYNTTEELLAAIKPFCEEQVALGNMAQSEANEIITKYGNAQN